MGAAAASNIKTRQRLQIALRKTQLPSYIARRCRKLPNATERHRKLWKTSMQPLFDWRTCCGSWRVFQLS